MESIKDIFIGLFIVINGFICASIIVNVENSIGEMAETVIMTK